MGGAIWLYGLRRGRRGWYKRDGCNCHPHAKNRLQWVPPAPVSGGRVGVWPVSNKDPPSLTSSGIKGSGGLAPKRSFSAFAASSAVRTWLGSPCSDLILP